MKCEGDFEVHCEKRMFTKCVVCTSHISRAYFLHKHSYDLAGFHADEQMCTSKPIDSSTWGGLSLVMVRGKVILRFKHA